MHDSYFTGIPWGRFMDFIAPEADRLAIIKELLEEAGLEFKIIDIGGNHHCVVAPPPPEEKFLRRIPTMLVAHYDRAEESPGANDNSSGVFMLLETAIKLKKGGVHNWIVIFTDKEELKPSESIQDQGAYALAMGLKSLKLENHKIFSFDACGCGDTLVISTTLEYLLKRERGGEKLLESAMELRRLALDAGRDLRMKKVLLAATPFSDDVGFFRAGLAAQTITMLPSGECVKLVSQLRKNPEYVEVLISSEQRKNNRFQFIPDTWRILNSPADSYLRLTPANFRTVVNFAEALCKG